MILTARRASERVGWSAVDSAVCRGVVILRRARDLPRGLRCLCLRVLSVLGMGRSHTAFGWGITRSDRARSFRRRSVKMVGYGRRATVMVDFARSVSRAGGSGATDFSLLIASPAPNLPRSSSSKPGMMLTAGRGAWRTGRAHPPSSRHQRSKLGSNCLGHRS